MRALAELTYPSTVRMFDDGVTGDGLWDYAMELLQGETLRVLVAREGPLPAARLVHLARQISTDRSRVSALADTVKVSCHTERVRSVPLA